MRAHVSRQNATVTTAADARRTFLEFFKEARPLDHCVESFAPHHDPLLFDADPKLRAEV